MIKRQIILDTETTGLRVEDGHRIIEIGCVELVNRKLTGNHFHYYINPERDIDAGAVAVHGITKAFLSDKPLFSSIAQSFIDYIAGAELIIHNAPFDLSFLDHELKKVFRTHHSLNMQNRIMDTLPLARKLHVGQRNSLDALCKRYGVDLSKREYHGALLDAHLLAQVYLAMTGGQSSLFDGSSSDDALQQEKHRTQIDNLPITKQHTLILKADETELAAHEQYLLTMKEKGNCQWLNSFEAGVY